VPIGADDPLLSVNRQQYAATAAVGRSQSDDPFPTVPFAERSLFDSASSRPHDSTGQSGRFSGQLPMCGQSIQETKQSAFSIKNRRRQAALYPFGRDSIVRSFRASGLVIAFCRAPVATCEPFLFIKE
jgi:hypothetical protein